MEIVLAKKQQPLILSVDDSSDDDEEGTFLQKTKHRPSKPSQVLQRAAVAAKTRRNPALKVTMQQKNPIQTKTKPVPPKRRPWQEDDSSSCVTSPSPLKKSKSSHNHNDPIPIDMDSSEDERPTNSRYFSSKPSKAGAQARNGCHFEDSDADDKTPIKSGNRPTSSSLEDTPSPAAAAAAAVTKRRVRPKFTKKITTKPLQDSSEDEQLQQAIRKSLQNNASKKTPRTKQLKKKNSLAQFAHPSSSLGLLEDSSDEEDNPQPKRTKNDDDDSSMDQDERLALKAALKASEKSAKQEKVKRRPTNGDVEDDAEEDEEPTLEQILGEESSDEEQENPEEAYDEERNAANSVLNTAEQLSAQVIQTMKEWMNNDDDDQDDHNNSGKTPQGMIVDGAISLGSLGGDHSHHTTSTSSHNHQWISQDVMKQACSGVTLSNYQLIGVNWLALLHGMECTIDNQKTNVNGVLADEMGLGKTVQTIAFLAWLKQQRANSNGHGRPHLIIVPVSVLPNWMREFETFCPEMKVVK